MANVGRGGLDFFMVSIFVAFISTVILYYYPTLEQKYPTEVAMAWKKIDEAKQFVYSIPAMFSKQSGSSSSTNSQKKTGIFTPEELKQYDGTPDSKGIYLAILGQVFDVEKGAQHYKPGGGYGFFSGKDATRAYLSGDFTEQGLIDDLSGLGDEMLYGLKQWIEFYENEYTRVGVVVGRYYDKDGEPTAELTRVMEAMKRREDFENDDEALKTYFPPCNSEFNQADGHRVWCSKQSGGVERHWVGVPRKYFSPHTGEEKCVCVRDVGPHTGAEPGDLGKDRGDLDNPNIREYPGCKPDSFECKLQ